MNSFLLKIALVGLALLVQMQGWGAMVVTNVPQTLAELDRWYAEPLTNQNGAIYFRAGGAIVWTNYSKNKYGNERDLPFFGWPFAGRGPSLTNLSLTLKTRRSITNFMMENRAMWPLLEAGARCEQSRYPIEMTNGIETSLPHLGEIRSGCQGCDVFALGYADAKQEEKAAHCLTVGLVLANSLEAEPLLISQITRTGCLNIMVDGLEQVLNRVSLKPNSLQELQSKLDTVERPDESGNSFRRALVGERLTWLSVFDPPNGHYSETVSNMIGSFTNLSDFLPASMATNTGAKQVEGFLANAYANRVTDGKFYLAAMDETLAAWSQEYPHRLDVAGFYPPRTSELDKQQHPFSLIVSDMNKGVWREARALAEVRLAKTAVALERYRAEHGNRYPEYLSVLATNYLSAVPRDPFANARLQYRKTEKGYLLYSVGKNRQDDGGSSTNDIIFQVISAPDR